MGMLNAGSTGDAACGVKRRGRAIAFYAAVAAAVAGVRTDAAPTTNIWNGGTGDWQNPTNWSTGVVPNALDADVFIDGGKDAILSTVTNGGTATMGNLTIDSGDSLSVSAANFYGDMNLNGALRINGGTGT